jgi:1,4-alpha-glucan branching enzyme
LLEREPHQGMKRLVEDLNQHYRSLSALHDIDFDASGFEWIDCHDSSQSVLSFLRKDKQGGLIAAAFNFTPVPRNDYRIGVPKAGFYSEVLNSDATIYGGSNVGNSGGAQSEPKSWMNRDHSITLNLPPLGGLILLHQPRPPASLEDSEKTTKTASQPKAIG